MYVYIYVYIYIYIYLYIHIPHELQHICYSTHAATNITSHHSTLQHSAAHLQCTATLCNAQSTTTHCSTQSITSAMPQHENRLQHTHYSTHPTTYALQSNTTHTATHLQHGSNVFSCLARGPLEFLIM